MSISLPALLILYLPLFAGILYEYRGGGRTAVVKIAGWIIAPVACQFSGYFSIPTALFFLIAEITLFLLALQKNWYQVDKKAVTISATGSLFAGIILCLLVLSIYVLRISLRQKSSFGYIIGCSCGITIGLQIISNILIVFGILPLTSTVLPFFASGFTYSFVDYALLGLILSIYRYKDIRKEKALMHKPRWRLRLDLVRDEGRMEEKI